MLSRRLVLMLASTAVVEGSAIRPVFAQQPPVTVFAAASLTEVLQSIGALWAASGQPAPRFSFASSSTLARQIEAGAPANVFGSADEQWADWLQQRDLIIPETRRSLLTNSLVIVVPKDRARTVQIGPGLDLEGLLGPSGRLATGDPAHVPVGIYAEAALKSLGLWSRVQPRLARTDNVRSALLLVDRGEAPAGIVYVTDAAADAGVAIAGTFPADSHPPVTYPFAVVRANDTPAARAFLDFLSGPQAREAFTRAGFGLNGTAP
jgi:molybdate transport system substrate-binding protein